MFVIIMTMFVIYNYCFSIATKRKKHKKTLIHRAFLLFAAKTFTTAHVLEKAYQHQKNNS